MKYIKYLAVVLFCNVISASLKEDSFDFSKNLVAYFPFNGNANDESGNGNNGAVNGATLTEDRFGATNKAYSFDGVDDFIDVGGDLNLTNGSNQTISVWIKPSSKGGLVESRLWGRQWRPMQHGVSYTEKTFSNLIYWNDSFQSSGDTFLHLTEELKPSFYMQDNFPAMMNALGEMTVTGTVRVVADTAISNDQWVHLCLVLNNKIARHYINGNVVSEVNLPHTYGHNGKTYISIGSAHGGAIGYFKGSIDEVRHYTRSLSSSEVRALASFVEAAGEVRHRTRSLSSLEDYALASPPELELASPPELRTKEPPQLYTQEHVNNRVDEAFNSGVNHVLNNAEEYDLVQMSIPKAFITGWIYSSKMGWIFTSDDYFPFVYSETLKTWIYYDSGKSKYFNYATQSWIGDSI